MKKYSFFEEFLKNWREVGSITPSSKFLVKKMLETVDFKNTKTILELGAGSGVMTLELLKEMPVDSKLVVFEVNKDFYNALSKISDKRLILHNSSALDLQKYFAEGEVDYIISGIPLATLSASDKKDLLMFSYKALRSSGRYIQFQYSLESKKDLESIFDQVSQDFTPLNIPPAFVFSCFKN
jgi:phospholipid N-methyltransferase